MPLDGRSGPLGALACELPRCCASTSTLYAFLRLSPDADGQRCLHWLNLFCLPNLCTLKVGSVWVA